MQKLSIISLHQLITWIVGQVGANPSSGPMGAVYICSVYIATYHIPFHTLFTAISNISYCTHAHATGKCNASSKVAIFHCTTRCYISFSATDTASSTDHLLRCHHLLNVVPYPYFPAPCQAKTTMYIYILVSLCACAVCCTSFAVCNTASNNSQWGHSCSPKMLSIALVYRAYIQYYG